MAESDEEAEKKEWLARAKSEGITVEVNGAVRFEDDVVLALLQADDDDDDRSTALVRLTLEGEAVSAEILQVFGSGIHTWIAESEGEHVFVLSGGYVSRLHAGEVDSLVHIEEGYVQRLVRVSPDTLAFVGDGGMLVTLRAGELTRQVTGTEEDLRVVAIDRGLLIAGGAYATLVRQQPGGDFVATSLVEGDVQPGISALCVAPDGSLRVGFDDGRACVVEGDRVVRWLEVERDEDVDTTILAATIYDGVELFGDDDHGLLKRVGDHLEPILEVDYGFGFHVDGPRLTIDSGTSIVLVDGGIGGRKRTITVNPEGDALVELAAD